MFLVDGISGLFEPVVLHDGVPPPPDGTGNNFVDFMNETRQQMVCVCDYVIRW